MIEPSPWAAIEPPWAVDPHQEPLICCNAWPLSLEVSARQGGLNGVASCTADHEREVATVTFEKKSVNVLCTDTIPRAQFKPKPISPAACTDAVMDKEKVGGKKVEVLEMSPAAMIDLSGRLDRALPVSVCYSGVKADDAFAISALKSSAPPDAPSTEITNFSDGTALRISASFCSLRPGMAVAV